MKETPMLQTGKCQLDTPRHESGGWIHWPDHEPESLQLMRLLGEAQEGAACVSECMAVASRIVVGDDECWHREWRDLADSIKKRANIASQSGHVATAKSGWLRALNYYRAASCFLPTIDARFAKMWKAAESCAISLVKGRELEGETVVIPFSKGKLHCYFLRLASSTQKMPVVICIGEPGSCKEDLLVRFRAYGVARGIALLLVDLPGQGGSLIRGGLRACHDSEKALRSCVDYLNERADVDGSRIALFGDGLGGAVATRAAASDDRYVAVVCDGGFWDECERRYFTAGLAGSIGGLAGLPRVRQTLATLVRAPMLVVVGEQDYAAAADFAELMTHCRSKGASLSLKVFSAEETGASHRQMDNPSIGRQFVFDWLKERMTVDELGRSLMVPSSAPQISQIVE